MRSVTEARDAGGRDGQDAGAGRRLRLRRGPPGRAAERRRAGPGRCGVRAGEVDGYRGRLRLRRGARLLSGDDAGHVGPRRLVLIGGLPGAGKTRLLSRLLDADDGSLCGLDSQYVAERLRDSGVRLPYRVLRPAVHAWHRLTVRRGIGGPAAPGRGGGPADTAPRPWGPVGAGRRG